MAEQGAGGVERQRHLSNAQPKSENEAVPETTTTTRAASTDQGKPQDYPQAGQPRAPSTPSPSPVATPTTRSQQALPSQPLHVSSHRQSRHSHHSTHHHSSQPARRKLEPPVTKGTLSELDVSKIIHNPKLRHDINFDPELHFRPNLDGEKGRKKQKRANEFWDALERQLANFANPATREKFMEECGPGKDWCLPELLKAVKDIIQTLVPVRDRAYLDEGLNIDLIMQQFYQGVADLEKLALWLSTVLKSHCAPMRDEWVDEMYRQLSDGNCENAMSKLVMGMRSLLGVLEAMKLDVANHQIRCLRPVLIEDTVNFEQKFFWKRMQTGRVNLTYVRAWYNDQERDYANSEAVRETRQSFGEMAVFMNALARLVLPSQPTTTYSIPNTFLYDEDRILKLRADLFDAINLEICMRMYEDLDKVSRLATISRANTEDADAVAASDFNFNAPPSRPGSGVFSSSGSSYSSSPRNSGCIFTQPVPSMSEVRSKHASVYSSLIALLQTAPSSSRPVEKWKALAPAMALEIFRFTEAPQDMLPRIEENLTKQLTDLTNSTYREVEDYYHTKLVAELAKRVKELKGVSGVNLFSVATAGRTTCSGARRGWNDGARDNADRETRDENCMEDIAIRMAHLGILHWRVWAPIAYIDEPGMNIPAVESVSVYQL